MRRDLLGDGDEGRAATGPVRGEIRLGVTQRRVWESRFDPLPTTEILGRELPVATRRRARLLGLALLDRDDAGEGLLIPGCRAVHTFGMRFPLDLVFLDPDLRVLELRRTVSASRLARCLGAAAILELPTA